MRMPHLGYKLSSEEFGPLDLIRQAVRAESAGFIRFYEREIFPRLRRLGLSRREPSARRRAA
jgi:hypothetical protein